MYRNTLPLGNIFRAVPIYTTYLAHDERAENCQRDHLCWLNILRFTFHLGKIPEWLAG